MELHPPSYARRKPRGLLGACATAWRRADTTLATVAVMLSGALWAICLAFPGNTVSRATYKHMAWLLPESGWLALFVGVVILQAWRLWAQVHGLPHAFWDTAARGVAAVVWTYVAIACMVAQYPPAAAVSDTVVIALAAWWDFVRSETGGARG